MTRFGIALLVAHLPLAAVADDAEDRLLSAELLEVSSGDFEKARSAFQAIAGDEKAPEAVRAKAQLGLARCQRKLGQLDGAKRTLEELVKASPKDAEVLRQAKSYLKELTTGRAENPEFDWVREIEKNPEIQTRVFDWAMQLVSVPQDQVPAAGKQLLALGTIALPVVERVLDASRDPAHRQHLALIAVRSGKLDRLAVLVDLVEPAQLHLRRIQQGIAELCDKVRASPAEERQAVLEVLSRAPRGAKIDPVRAAFELAAGDFRDFPAKLLAIEESPLFSLTVLPALYFEHPEALDVFAARVLDSSASFDARARYLDELFFWDPAKLTREHCAVVEDAASQAQRGSIYHFNASKWVEDLERLGKFDLLLDLASGNTGGIIIERFRSAYVEGKKLGAAPGAWGALLRRTVRDDRGALQFLHDLAEVNDEAAAELVGLLRARRTEAPGVSVASERRRHGWTPSPKYVSLMLGLLDSEDDEVLAVALAALARARDGLGPEALPLLERLHTSRSISPARRAGALTVLLRLLEVRPETGPAVAAIDWKARGGWDRPLELDWDALGGAPAAVWQSLFRHVLALDLKEEDASWLKNLFNRSPHEDALKLLLECIPGLDSAPKRAAVLLAFGADALVNYPAGAEFLKTCAQDSSMRWDLRVHAATSAGEAGLAWIDWTQLVTSGNPVVESVSDDVLGKWLVRRPKSEQDAFLDALGRSASAVLRESRLDIYPRDRAEFPEVLRKALDDPSEAVQRVAAGYLLKIEELRGPALYRSLLEHRTAKRLAALYEQVAESADAELLEPLVKLLDDREPSVRKLALGALEKIRKELEQKREWQGILQAARERRKE